MDYFNPNDAWMRHNDYKDTNLTEQEQVNRGCMQAVVYFIAFIIGILICSLFSSCKSVEYVPVIEHHTDTLIQTNIQRDSIYVHDSISVTQKGDTISIDRWHTKYIEKQVHDTLYISKTDSVPAPYPVEVIKEVPAELTWWELLKMKAGGIAILFCIFAFIFWIWKSK